jgi:translocation and assembly module TamB
MTLQGALTLDPSRVRLPSTISAQAPHIEVREINTNATEADPSERTAPFPLHLDLNVDIPARLTVQGRGLDSEWSGDFHLGGTHQIEPAVSGEATLLRGKLDFLDRTFDLTKGSLVFSGETPPNPFLDIIGEVRVLDTMIQVNLTGPARSPRLNLSSVPALPQDELLSMILFGRSMREISPLQAVRLAQAAAEMTGIGGAGPGFLQSVKSKLGLQELEVSRDEDDNTAVGIGGYIGGKYYFRTRSSVSGQDKTTVEIHLTPDISVETEVGSDSRQGGGINWKHDY